MQVIFLVTILRDALDQQVVFILIRARATLPAS